MSGDFEVHPIGTAARIAELERLRAELEKRQEPVAWMYRWKTDGQLYGIREDAKMDSFEEREMLITPLYVASVAKPGVSVPRVLLQEARYLVAREGASCPRWKEGIGDCDLPACDPCRIRRCADALQDALAAAEKEQK